MNPIRIVLFDDHSVVREGLKALIHAQGDMIVVAEGENGADLLEVVQTWDPDIVMLDIAMPVMNGIEAAKALRTVQARARILILSAYQDAEYLHTLFQIGIAGYILKQAAGETLIQAIRTIAADGIYLDRQMADHLVPRPAQAVVSAGPQMPLSERELDTMQLIARGYSNKEVAAQLQISVKTVETYKTRAMEKMDFHSRVDLVRYAATHGWLDQH